MRGFYSHKIGKVFVSDLVFFCFFFYTFLITHLDISQQLTQRLSYRHIKRRRFSPLSFYYVFQKGPKSLVFVLILIKTVKTVFFPFFSVLIKKIVRYALSAYPALVLCSGLMCGALNLS